MTVVENELLADHWRPLPPSVNDGVDPNCIEGLKWLLPHDKER